MNLKLIHLNIYTVSYWILLFTVNWKITQFLKSYLLL